MSTRAPSLSQAATEPLYWLSRDGDVAEGPYTKEQIWESLQVRRVSWDDEVSPASSKKPRWKPLTSLFWWKINRVWIFTWFTIGALLCVFLTVCFLHHFSPEEIEARRQAAIEEYIRDRSRQILQTAENEQQMKRWNQLADVIEADGKLKVDRNRDYGSMTITIRGREAMFTPSYDARKLVMSIREKLGGGVILLRDDTGRTLAKATAWGVSGGD